MSNEKYLEVKLENRMLSNGFKAIKPEDIIYLEHWFDTSYDHSSENMGHFITLIYNKGGEIVAEWFNPDDWKPIGNLIKEGKDTFVKTKKHLWGIHSFFNKNALKDLRIEKGRLVYKDKYIFNPEAFEAFGGKTLWLPDSFDSKNFESYTPDHAKDPLKD